MWGLRKKGHLANKSFYDDIDRAMAGLAEPTVRDATSFMRAQGNTAYVKAFGTRREKPMSNNVEQLHEVSHLAARLGHCMQNEAAMIYFQVGLKHGPGFVMASSEKVDDLHSKIEATEKYYRKIASGWYETSPNNTSNASKAVYFAAGMYLSEKIDRFLAAGLLDKPYAERQAFCRDYGDGDHVPDPMASTDKWLDRHFLDPEGPKWKDISDAPYALLKLTKQEWRAIEAVALNIAPPEQTKYPQRMQAIKDALIRVGLAYDRPKSIAEREERRRIESATNEGQHRA